MHKNAQNVEWKTLSKISCNYTWLLHGKNCPSQWRFNLQASPVGGQSLQQKEKKRTKRKGEKKIQKSKKPKDIGHFLFQKLKILISVHAQAKNVLIAMPVERKVSFCVANAFLTRLKLIWPISSLKNSKMTKKCVFGKKLLEAKGYCVRQRTLS